MGKVTENRPGSADVAIIGGGISGLSLALAAAKQGIGVAVLDAGDFGGGATLNSLRIVHGGLRYLQTFNVARARRSIRSRRELMKFAPGIIRPMECRVPLSTWGVRSRLPLTAGCVLADTLGWDRNAGVAEENRLPASNVWRRTYVHSGDKDGVPVPAVGWWDAVLWQPHRLIVKLVKECALYGVHLANHSEVTELIVDKNDGIAGLRYRVLGQSESESFGCNVVVDAAGHGGRTFRQSIASLKPVCDWVGAANFLLDEEISNEWAIGYRTRECAGINEDIAKLGNLRDFFLVPTPAGPMIGTTYTLVERGNDQQAARARAFRQLLSEAGRARPDRKISASDVRHLFWGLLPATPGVTGNASGRLLGRDIVVDGATDFDLPGYFRVQSVKLTTALELAAKVVPLLQRYLSKMKHHPQMLAEQIESPTQMISPPILEFDRPSDVKRALKAMQSAEIEGLVRHCVLSEYARKLEDLLQRRLGLLPFDYPDAKLLQTLGLHMAAQLRWDDNRTSREIEEAGLAIATGQSAGLAAAAHSRSVTNHE